MEWLTEGLTASAAAWTYALAAALIAVAALFPPVPSTCLFVALGALSTKGDAPNGWLLVVAMLTGAVAGDLATYLLVRRRDVTTWRVLRGARAQKALILSKERMTSHAVSWVLTSRFIPLGRLVMNVACALTPVPWRTFTLYSIAASIVWSAYSVGMGALSGLLPGLSTEVAVVLAIALSLILGRAIDAVATWYLLPEDRP